MQRTILKAISALTLFATAFAADKLKDYAPQITPADFSAKITNPYFPLVPGTTTKFKEVTGSEVAQVVSIVTHDTRTIMGVKCVVVHETIKVDGNIKEDTFDWYAQHKDGSVWYFGEDTKEYKSGGRVSTEGSWEGGVNGAQPGIIMPADLKVGFRFRQEYLRSVAEDMGEISALAESVTVPAGSYPKCVRTRDWSMLESGSSKKWYAPGIGFVRSEAPGEVCELVSITKE